MLFVFRLVFAPSRQGYTATLGELWDHCRALDVLLPQPAPVSDAAMVRARRKVHPQVFRQFHAEILRRAERPGPLWLGHRVFAVDGSKLSLPRPLREAGYPLPNHRRTTRKACSAACTACTPGCPSISTSTPTATSARAARAHLRALVASDLVVYDRGYYSFELLCAHRQRGLQAVFRIRRKAGHALDRFIASDLTDTIAEIFPGPDALRELGRKHPRTVWRPVPLRLVKYTCGGTEYVLGTTLLDRRRYSVTALADLYHARWGIEEMYKVSKQFLEVDQFHGRTESLVQQELWAHFNLIAMTPASPTATRPCARRPSRRTASRRRRPTSSTAWPSCRGISRRCCCATRSSCAKPSRASPSASGWAGAGPARTAPTRDARSDPPRNGPDANRSQPSCLRSRQTAASGLRRGSKPLVSAIGLPGALVVGPRAALSDCTGRGSRHQPHRNRLNQDKKMCLASQYPRVAFSNAPALHPPQRALPVRRQDVLRRHLRVGRLVNQAVVALHRRPRPPGRPRERRHGLLRLHLRALHQPFAQAYIAERRSAEHVPGPLTVQAAAPCRLHRSLV